MTDYNHFYWEQFAQQFSELSTDVRFHFYSYMFTKVCIKAPETVYWFVVHITVYTLHLRVHFSDCFTLWLDAHIRTGILHDKKKRFVFFCIFLNFWEIFFNAELEGHECQAGRQCCHVSAKFILQLHLKKHTEWLAYLICSIYNTQTLTTP